MSNYTTDNLIPVIPQGGVQAIKIGDTVLVINGSGSSGGSGQEFYLCTKVQDTLGYYISGYGALSSFTGLYVDMGTSGGTQTWVQTSGGSVVSGGGKMRHREGYYDTWIENADGSQVTRNDGDFRRWGTVAGWDQWANGSASSIPTPVNSGWWNGLQLVYSGGYYTVLGYEGGEPELKYTHIVPEPGTVYSEDALIVVKDYWRQDYGMCVNALGIYGIGDTLGSYYMNWGFSETPDANGFYWNEESEYVTLMYGLPGTQEYWEGDGGNGEPWNARANAATIQFTFIWDGSEHNYPEIFNFYGENSTYFKIKLHDDGSFDFPDMNDIATGTWTMTSNSITANTAATFTLILDRDYIRVLVDGTLRAIARSVDNGSKITSLTFRNEEATGNFGYKDAKMWNRARRDLIPGYTPVIISSGTPPESHLVVSSGSAFTAASGKIWPSAEVQNGGDLIISGATVNSATVSGGGLVNVYNGGSAHQCTVQGNIINQSLSYGFMSVYSGGTVTSSILDGGAMYVYSGGTAIDIQVKEKIINYAETLDMLRGFLFVQGGYAANVNLIYDHEGIYGDEPYMIVANGGLVSSTSIGSYCSATAISGGTLSNGVVMGLLTVSSGGTATGFTVSSGGTMIIWDGGAYSNITSMTGAVIIISSGGNQYNLPDPEFPPDINGGN